ncbi:MAG: right-handed parallel beta-helix repeat-containing protein [Armatimonadetes bacterium]|nr:right-handed parallel beta-helix repeat-containing protein [Armatimonadota bacterium]
MMDWTALGISVVLAAVGGLPSSLPARDGRTVQVDSAQKLAQAVREARDGDTILIRDGEYRLGSPLWVEGKKHITLRGESEDPGKTVLKGGGWTGGKPEDILVIRGSEDIAVGYLTFMEAHSYGIKIEGVKGLMNPRRITVTRCIFRDIATRHIKGTATDDRKPMEGGLVRYCRFENTRIPDRRWLFEGDYVSAIDMMFLKDWTFADNTFKNIKGANGGGRGAVFIWNQSRNVLVERNTFIGCDRSIAFGNPSEPTNYVPGTLHNYDGIIRNNFITAGAGKGIELVWLDNVKVYHNTVYCPDPNGLGIHYFRKISRLDLANNLVRGRIEGEGEAALRGNVAGPLEGYFVDPLNGDLHLTAKAAGALKKAVPLPSAREDIDGEKRGKPADVGADERQGEGI